MKYIWKIAGLALFCVLMTAGCSDEEPAEETTVPVQETAAETAEETTEAPAEQTETTEVLFLNDSGKDIVKLTVKGIVDGYEEVDVTEGEALKDGDMMSVPFPRAEGLYQVTAYTEDGPLFGEEMSQAQWDLNNNGIMIFPKAYVPELMSCEGSWGEIDDAADAVNHQIALNNGEIGPEADRKKQEAQDAALAKLGFKTLEEYRRSTHEQLYLDDNENEMSDLVGYWYPDGDMNSTEYFAILENNTVQYWKFNGTEDEMTGYTSIALSALGTYTLRDDRKMSFVGNALRFQDSDTKYEKSDF